MKPLHALYLALAFIAIAMLLVGEPGEGPLARMSGNSTPDRNEQSSASGGPGGAQQSASNDEDGFAYDPADDVSDSDFADNDEFEYYGDEDISAQAADTDDADEPVRTPRPPSPKFIIPKGSPPPELSVSGPRIIHDEESHIERARP